MVDVTECISKKDTHEKCVEDSANQQHDAHQVVESDALDCKVLDFLRVKNIVIFKYVPTLR